MSVISNITHDFWESEEGKDSGTVKWERNYCFPGWWVSVFIPDSSSKYVPIFSSKAPITTEPTVERSETILTLAIKLYEIRKKHTKKETLIRQIEETAEEIKKEFYKEDRTKVSRRG